MSDRHDAPPRAYPVPQASTAENNDSYISHLNCGSMAMDAGSPG